MSKRKSRGKAHSRRRRKSRLYRTGTHNKNAAKQSQNAPQANQSPVDAAAARLEEVCRKQLASPTPPPWHRGDVKASETTRSGASPASLSAAAADGLPPQRPEDDSEQIKKANNNTNERADASVESTANRPIRTLEAEKKAEPLATTKMVMPTSAPKKNVTPEKAAPQPELSAEQQTKQPKQQQQAQEKPQTTQQKTQAAPAQQTAQATSAQKDPSPEQPNLEKDGKTADQAGKQPVDAKQSVEKKTAKEDKSGGDGPSDPTNNSWKRVQRPRNDDYRQVLSKGLAACRADLISVGVFSVVLNLLILAIPIYLFQVSDRVLTSSSTDTLIMLTVVVIGALAIYALLDIIRRYLLMRVATRLETTLGGPVLSAAAKSAQFGSTREFQTLQDLQQIRNFITGPVILAMYDAPIAPVYFLAVYMIHPHLGIIVTVAALILTCLAIINQKVTAVPFSRANAFAMRAGFQAEAMARNAQIVNAMGMIQEGVMHWGRETSEALKSQVAAQDRNVQFAGLSKFLRLATQVSMLGWGAYLAIGGELTGGMMIAASIIGSRALAPVEGLIEGWRGYVQARGGFARIKALLGNSPLNLERLTLPRPQGRLRVERVLYVPPPTKKVILNGVDFSMEPGESLAIVGPSGTGKSTLARMLVGSITPTSGAVRLDLMDIRNWDPRQFGETVGYLPQDVQLFPASIKANIARLREDVTDEMIFDAAELAGVHEMISQFPQGYETQIGIDGSPLSGGQRQRLGLARAFFGDPRLVVLDEPNSNLDTAGEVALSAALKRAKRKGITIVAVTQRPALLKSVDRIMLLHEGRVQKLGPRDEVLPLLAGRPRKAITDAA